jgi:ABC-type transporter MlaC component
MPNNSLINIAQVLAQRVGEKSPTQLADMMIDNGVKKQLNYEIMFQLLMGECEKHILENQGNAVVDEFKNNIVQKFSVLMQGLTPNE